MLLFSTALCTQVLNVMSTFLASSSAFTCSATLGLTEAESNNIIYYTLKSLSLFWLAESVRWIFEISARDVITADYTIIMSRTLKVTDNHVMYDCGAWFLRVIMSSSRALCCLPSVKKQKYDFNFFPVQCRIKQILGSVFVISRVIEVSVKVISPSLRLRLITLTSTSIILDITKTSSNNCLEHSGFQLSVVKPKPK